MKHTTGDPQPRELPHVLKQNHVHNEKESKKQLFYRLADSVVLLVTLIATATFAAAFTVPGGFDGNEGSEQGICCFKCFSLFLFLLCFIWIYQATSLRYHL